MSKRPWLKKIASAALLGSLLLGSVGIAYAADNDTVADTANKVKSKFNSMMRGGRGHGPGMMGQEMGLGANLGLDALVQDGVITSDESTAIQNKIDALDAQRQSEISKIQAMTAEERQAYFEARKTAVADKDAVKTDFLTTLVNEKIISSDKAEAIRTAQQSLRQAEMQDKLNTELTALVDEGTITSAQNDAILAALEAQQKQRQTEMVKVKAMTAEERAAYFKDNRPVCNDCLADLVTAGTITQTQADAVCNVIGGPRGKGQGNAAGANCGNCPNNNGGKPFATPGQGGNGEGKGYGGKGHSGMGQAKGQGMGMR